jgi:glycosyltransferase involved in cell wall biosynthesis
MSDRLQEGAIAQDSPGPRVAYLMSRFPKLTETFVLCEMLAVEQQGTRVEIYPLQRERAKTMHPEAEPLVERAHYQPLLSPAILASNLAMLLERPRAYLGTLATLVRANAGSARYLLGALAFFPKVVHFARGMDRARISHVHAHFASHPAAAAFVIRRLVGIPYSFTAHGSDLHRDRHMLREKVAEARCVVAISHYNREVIAGECGDAAAGRVRVIHCGVDTELFRPDEAGRPAARPLAVVCTGTLHEVKGQTHLIEALRRLAERGVEFSCELIGDGPDRRALARQVEAAGLDSHVAFLGSLTRGEVAARLRAADVLVAPSVPTANGRREGIPVALMEAAACGLAIVASGISGIPELVEDGKLGFLVPPGDAGALAQALERLASDPELRRQFGAEARRKALAEFDLHQNARELARQFAREAQP